MRSDPRRFPSIHPLVRTFHPLFKTFLTLLAGLTLSACCCGARTGLEVPPATVITFERGGAIYEAAPGGGMPAGRIRVAGPGVLNHSVHGGGDWTAYSTSAGLWVQDWRGYRTNRHAQNGISGIDWTADTRRVAFVRADRIWMIDAAGSGGPTALTPAPGGATGFRAMTPSWTPDGGSLVYVRYRQGLDPGGNPVAVEQELWTVGADGSAPRPLFAGRPRPEQIGVAVSRDGSAVLYSAGFDATPSIIRLDLATGATSTLLSNARQPAFSASGQNLAFIRGGQVWACRYEGTTCTNEHPVSSGPSDHTPSWVGG
jgi:WD40-like Beta Propeller Repeat